MSQPKAKTTFKTYEASTRLLAAVIATTNVKLDYNAIAKHVGTGIGADAINHRFRPIKQLAKMQAAYVQDGRDPGDLPTEKGELAANFGDGATAVALQHRFRPIIQLAKLQLHYRAKGKDPSELPTEKGEIHKLFGESTPEGLKWQMAGIKHIGKAQQEAVKKGENPATVMATGTPSAGRGRGRPAGTPGSGASARTPGTGTRGRKRKVAATTLPPVESSDEGGDNDSEYTAETPSRGPAKKRAATASAKKANGSTTTPVTTPAKAATGTPGAAGTPAMTATPTPHTSLFGGDARGPSMAGYSVPLLNNAANNPEYASWGPKPVSKPVKQEFGGINADSFLSSVNSGGFDEGEFEDGEF